MSRLLRVEPTRRPEIDERWQINPMVYGSLVHEILDRFLRTLHRDGRPRPGEAYTNHDRALIHQIAGEECAAMAARGETGHPLVWKADRARLRSELDAFLLKDHEMRGDDFQPDTFEQPFGFTDNPDSWPPVVIPLEQGRTVELRGYIDRVDLAPNAARIIDYKTGKLSEQSVLDLDPVGGGTMLQLAVYASAAQLHGDDIGQNFNHVDARYWFVGTRGKFDSITVTASSDVTERLTTVLSVIDDGVRNGSFMAVPGPETWRPGRDSWDNCLFCDFDRVCATSRALSCERKSADGAAVIRTRLALEAMAQ